MDYPLRIKFTSAGAGDGDHAAGDGGGAAPRGGLGLFSRLRSPSPRGSP